VLWHPSPSWENEPTRYLDVARKRKPGSWKLRRRSRTISTDSLIVGFDTDPVRLRFADADGASLSEAAAGPCGYFEQGAAITWAVSRSEAVYGLGQNAFVDLDRVGQRRDMAAYHAGHVGGDVPIPFWISTRGYGVVVDNPNVAQFDLSHKGRITFAAADGYLSYYVLSGPTMQEVLRRYAELTGRAPMPPLWSLGPQFSRVPWGDVPGYRTAEEVVALAGELRERSIPSDTLILDFQWDEWIGAFRWNTKHFKRARWMLRELDRLGFKTILILKPAVNLRARTYGELRRAGLLLRRLDGSVHTGNYHRGRSAFIDFFNDKTLAWYRKRLARLMEHGVAGWWTDEGDWLGSAGQTFRDLVPSAASIRNRYNNAWARTLYDGQRDAVPTRVVNITRTGGVGIQRYGTSLWSGDVSASWECLAAQVQMGLNAGLSGIPFWTTDGGGFLGNPSRELYVRWAQFAAFCPLTRFHGFGPREPWHYGARAERVVRHILQERMRLMPYVYSAARHAHVGGLPMMRAMAMAYPKERRFRNVASQYFFGDSLLVRPITQPRAQIVVGGGKVYTELGPGRWYDYWTGKPLRAKRRVAVEPKPDVIPVYVRAPAVIVRTEPSDSTRDQLWDPLTAAVYVGDMARPWETTFELYEDDGATYDYENGKHRITSLTATRVSSRSFALTATPRGRVDSDDHTERGWRLEVFGLPAPPIVRVGRAEHPATARGDSWWIDLPMAARSTRWKAVVVW